MTALRAHASTIRENVEHIARGCRAATSHNPAPYLNAIEVALVAIEGGAGDPSPGHSVKVPPRTPQVGERWLHDRLGEVEVLDTSTYRPDGAEWLVVQKRFGEDKRRWSVPPASLIGRAE